MEISPSYAQLKEAANEGRYNVYPVSCQILSDCCTPIQALRKLKGISDHCYMLESAEKKQRWGRYTFLGFEPAMEITCTDGRLTVNGTETFTSDPAAEIRKILAEYRSPRLPGLPPFTGGLVGYFAYDYVKYYQPKAKTDVTDDEGFKDLDLMLFDKVIAFDNFGQKITIIVNVRLCDLEAEYERAAAETERIRQILVSPNGTEEYRGKIVGTVRRMFDKEQYCKMVRRAQEYITEGDIFQIVLSNRLSARFEGSLFDAYRLLRTINPSPYMFYISGTDLQIAGASPETLIKLENGVLHTFPLAGTRPRGKDEEQDRKLQRELLADEKELAEHNMLVDLGRNDLGKICKFGSVKIDKLHSVEKYSHVMHIGSTVSGVIRDEFDALDAIAAALPAGTLSGAPKVRACQLIGQLEGIKRGIYGGAIGYIDFTGNLDVCIAIRAAYERGGVVHVRSGAGIVADSVPENEYQECINKAQAVMQALQSAGGGTL